MDKSDSQYRAYAWQALVVILVTLVVYLPLKQATFKFDDFGWIVGHELLNQPDALRRIWLDPHAAPQYYPVTLSLLWAEHKLWGEQPLGYHAVGVTLHLACALLLWAVLKQLRVPGAWVAAALFAAHPVNVMTVGWATAAHKNTVAMMFASGALWAYLRMDGGGRGRWYEISLLLFLLALLSKTAVAALPIVVLLCVWWRHGTVRQRDVMRALPMLALALIVGVITVYIEQTGSIGQQTVRPEGFASRIAAAGWCVWFYLIKALIPVNLIAIYPRWHVPVTWWAFLPSLFLILTIAGGVMIRRRWSRAIVFALCAFVAMLLPALGFVDISFMQYSLVADHWQYFAIIAPVAIAVAAGNVLLRRANWSTSSMAVVAMVVISVFAAAGYLRADRVFRADETLWRDTIARNPDVAIAHNNLGLALSSRKEYLQAVDAYERAIELDPHYVGAYTNLGNAYLRLGNWAAGESAYRQALEHDRQYVPALKGLALILAQTGRLDESLQQLLTAVKWSPHDAGVWLNLGNVHRARGDTASAIIAYKQSFTLRPDSYPAAKSLADALAAAGRHDEARIYEQRAKALQPR